MRRISIGFRWQSEASARDFLEQVKVADDCGVDTVWVDETWGADVFTLLAWLATQTRNIKVGPGIVNIFSRSPAALAQHFATLDMLSEGRAVIGLGTTSANVVEHFHGIPFDRPLTRMRECVDIIRMLLRGEPLKYEGKIFKLERGFTFREFHPRRDAIPIFIGSITPRSVRLTAEIADGWMPMWTPRSHWESEVSGFRDLVATAGRDPAQTVVRSSGSVVVTDEPERAYERIAATTAYYVARMGDFHYEHFVRMGFGEVADRIRAAWQEGGSAAGRSAVPPELVREMGVAGPLDECIEWIDAQAAAGYGMHSVSIAERDPGRLASIYREFVG